MVPFSSLSTGTFTGSAMAAGAAQHAAAARHARISLLIPQSSGLGAAVAVGQEEARGRLCPAAAGDLSRLRAGAVGRLSRPGSDARLMCEGAAVPTVNPWRNARARRGERAAPVGHFHRGHAW